MALSRLDLGQLNHMEHQKLETIITKLIHKALTIIAVPRGSQHRGTLEEVKHPTPSVDEFLPRCPLIFLQQHARLVDRF